VVSGQASVSSTHWSPAGDWIAYENGGEIWRVNANGYQYGHAAITVPGVPSHLSDAWSPDGQTVAVTDWWDGAYIWLYDAFGDGSTGRRLTAPSSWLPLEMTWSPDGKTITVRAGKLDQVLARNFANVPEAADYHARYIDAASDTAGRLQPAARPEDRG